MSTQGFVISLPYCFLNTEVQGVLRSGRSSSWSSVFFSTIMILIIVTAYSQQMSCLYLWSSFSNFNDLSFKILSEYFLLDSQKIKKLTKLGRCYMQYHAIDIGIQCGVFIKTSNQTPQDLEKDIQRFRYH